MGGLFLLGSVFGVLAILVPISLVLGLVVVLALRGEPDDGGRGMTLYLALATFAGFLVALVAVTALAAAVTDLVANDEQDAVPTVFGSGQYDSSSGSGSFEPYTTATTFTIPRSVKTNTSFGAGAGQSHDDRAWTTIIQTLLALAAALAVLRFHWPRLEAVGARAGIGSAATKARQAYCYAVCFLVVVTLLVAATVAAFNVVQMVAPGTTGAANRGDAIESFIPVFVLAVGAAALFRLHWARVDTPAFLQPPPPPDVSSPA